MIRTSVTTALIIAGTAAFAGNTQPAEPALPPAPPVIETTSSTDWTGFYAGLHYSTGTAGDGTVEFDSDGFGIHAGYLYDLGSIVIGGEVDLESININTVEWDIARFQAVAGYDAGALLPYVTLGIASVDISSGFEDTIEFFGLGATYQVTDNIRVGGEYLLHDTNDFDDEGPVEFDAFNLNVSYSF